MVLSQATMGHPSRLQADLAASIAALVRERRLAPGTRLNELRLARAFRVSRTPVRAALRLLASRGILEARPNQGFFLAVPGDAIDRSALPPSGGREADRLYLAIARDRLAGLLPDDFSEADLIRRYGVSRPLLVRVLGQMAEVGLVARDPGRGWSFLPAIETESAQQESYRFRMLVEPAALLEPGFVLDREWAERMRARHQRFIEEPWEDTASIPFFEMNAEFHERLAASSGNRYLHMAVQQQNRLRRFLNYDWLYGAERVVVSCREHLEILDRLEEGDRELAALLMRRHLERASRLTRTFGTAAAAAEERDPPDRRRGRSVLSEPIRRS